MSEQLALEIQGKLATYLAGDLSIRDFRTWFDASTWDIASVGDPEASEIASEIELRLAEFSNGDWTEQELRQKLIPLVQVYSRYEHFWGNSGFRYRTSASESYPVSVPVIVFETSHPGLPAGTVLSSESA